MKTFYIIASVLLFSVVRAEATEPLSVVYTPTDQQSSLLSAEAATLLHRAKVETLVGGSLLGVGVPGLAASLALTVVGGSHMDFLGPQKDRNALAEFYGGMALMHISIGAVISGAVVVARSIQDSRKANRQRGFTVAPVLGRAPRIVGAFTF